MNGNAQAISETMDLIRKMAEKLFLATTDENVTTFELKVRVAFLSQAVMRLEEIQSKSDQEGMGDAEPHYQGEHLYKRHDRWSVVV